MFASSKNFDMLIWYYKCKCKFYSNYYICFYYFNYIRFVICSWFVIELTLYIINTSSTIVILRANPSVCPRRRRRHVRTSKNTVFCGTKCTCPWSWLSSCNAQLSYLCVECYNNNIIINIIIIITSIILIPSSQLNVKFNGGGNSYS